MQKRISPQRTYNLNSKGLTLIEIMIVLAIIGAVVAFGVPKLSSPGSKVRTVARRLSTLTKELHNAARLSQKTYRLAFDLGGGEADGEEKKEQTYWVESSSKPGAVFGAEDDDDASNDDKKPPSDFQMDTTIIKKPERLPQYLSFEDIEIGSQDKIVKTGNAYIHFLPQGFAEESAIHITDKKELHWTIHIRPLTGQGEVIGSYKSVRGKSGKK